MAHSAAARHYGRSGAAADGDTNVPPPSTLTAQIIEHHNINNDPSGNSTFRQLLDEIRASPSAVETDPDGNHKLVAVVAEAGLNASALQDPFVSHDFTRQQILACLEVIGIALRRTPEILMRHAQHITGLCWLLISKMAILMNFAELRQHVQCLLRTISKVLSKSPVSWKHRDLFEQILKVAAEDARCLLTKRLDTLSKRPTSELMYPSSTMLGNLAPYEGSVVAAPSGKRVTVQSNEHGLYILSAFIDAICSLDRYKSPKFHDNGLNQRWAVKTLHSVWREFIKKRSPTHAPLISSTVLAIPLDGIRGAVVNLLDIRQFADATGGILKYLLDCTEDLLKRPLILSCPELAASFVGICLLILLGIKNVTPGKRVVEMRLKVRLLAIQDNETLLASISEQARCIVKIFIHCFKPNGLLCLRALPPRGRVRDFDKHSSVALQQISAFLNSDSYSEVQGGGDGERPAKRIKRQQSSGEPKEAGSTSAIQELSQLFRGWDSQISQRVAGIFADLPKEKQICAFKLLGNVFCQYAPPAQSKLKMPPTCVSCNRARIERTHTAPSSCDEDYEKTLIDVLEILLKSNEVATSNQFKVTAMSALKRVACHTSMVEALGFEHGVLGKWCLHGLRSSSRELRIAAGTALRMFLAPSPPSDSDLIKQNRVTALNILRSLSQADEPRIHETVVLAFGQVALACTLDELNLVLLQLLEYLGNPNPMLSGLAYLEIQNIAARRHETVEGLMRPYWRTIAISVTKDLRKKPQKAQHVAELLSWSVERLLHETQEFYLPYLVLWGQSEILERLAKAEGNNVNVWELCLRPGNLSPILALLLSQHPTNGEAVVGQCLRAINRDIHDTDVLQLFKLDPAAVARELLLIACQSEDEGKGKAIQAVKEFALIVERRGHSTRSSTTQARMISIFCDNHALGVVNYLSLSIESSTASLVEKRRAVRAIELLVLTVAADATVALPQIRACLQSSFDNPELCNAAFSAWTAVLTIVDGETLETIINQTFVIVVQKWSLLDADTQSKAYDTIASILHNYSSLVQGIVDLLPSLSSIQMMDKFETQLSRFRSESEVTRRLISFAKRCSDENSLVVLQSLRELRPYLEQHQRVVHDSAIAEHPLPVISDLMRSLLDACDRFSNDQRGMADACAECLGVIGCLDPNRVETVKDANLPLMHSNFKQAGEAVEFVAFLLEHVLVKVFQSTPNPRAQGFLAYVMQELLKFCGFNKEALAGYRPHGSQGDEIYHRWIQMPEATRQTLGPFLSSHYVLKANALNHGAGKSHPIYAPTISHSTWLRDFLLDSFNKAKGDNAQMIFNVIARIARGCDLSIVSLILPYAVANIVLDGTNEEVLEVERELLAILQQPTSSLRAAETDHLRHCSENVFEILDYLSRWMQSKKRTVTANRNSIERSGRPSESWEVERERVDLQQISNVEALLSRIPSDIISRRASECGSFARAILHWEKHMRDVHDGSESELSSEKKESMNRHLQELYTGIDEPDGVEGLSLNIHALDPEKQAMEHRRAGRWTAAQSWYNLRVEEQPLDKKAHIKLLSCLREASRFTSILRHVDNIPTYLAKEPAIQSIAAEAAWSTSDWDWLARSVQHIDVSPDNFFNFDVGVALKHLRAGQIEEFRRRVQNMRHVVARNLSGSTTSSLQSCREQLFKLHTLYEIEFVSGITESSGGTNTLHPILERRLDVLGSSHADKQYLLGLRRAVAQLSYCKDKYDLASSWMTTAKLARKGSNLAPAYDAVFHAAKLGDESSAIEQARLLWKEGEHRKAIQSLESAMGTSVFTSTSGAPAQSVVATSNINPTTSFGATFTQDPQAQHKMLIASAQLLMAKWIDKAGQTSGDVILQQYRQVTYTFQRWEKGLYNLGKFYNKLLEFERAQPPSRQSVRCLSGETAKLVIENYLRSLTFGCKYINETLPKLLTLWLDWGVECLKQLSREVPNDVREVAADQRLKFLDVMNKQVKKYAEKISTFVFYTALAQMITRISHENQSVWEVLAHLIVKVASAHPQQTLWSVLATVKSSAQGRARRGLDLLHRLKQSGSKTIRNEGTSVDLKDLVTRGQKLSDELLRACEVAIQGRTTHVSLTRDLGFKVKVAPCPLVIPWEKTLTASLPVTSSSREMKAHKAFPMTREAVTVSSFEDGVLVLSSLQKPRKLVVKGSDGQKYGLLCKPNDDLRKDQRLMEFNALINKALKKDTAASTRRLYIKTYAVTPLNEACGLIEWVEGLKPLRDILMALYRSKGVKIDYTLLRQLLADACANPPDSTEIFTKQLLDMYSPILHEWFTENFPAPDAWYGARTRYTRSCAVTSMVGNALGLGDRHGENVLLEEKNGGVFHVDFNCLFDKGLTFEKPEVVPFRLTHNMVEAMGATGVEGFYRRAAEATLSVMREQEDALLTILETFVYDPTADFVSTRHRTTRIVNVPGITAGIGSGQTIPETPREVLEGVRGKLKGLLPGESLPLNVQGYVAALITMATDAQRLARMYIGWCAFL